MKNDPTENWGYPTAIHRQVSEKVVEIFQGDRRVEAILLVGSCARGKATVDSCVDFTVLTRPKTFASLQRDTSSIEARVHQLKSYHQLLRVGAFSEVHIDYSDGTFKPGYHGWTTGPDNFELEIGNILAYSVPLFERSDYFQRLRDQWLPYYSEDLRHRRLAEKRRYFYNNLDHIPLYAERGLVFAAFHRLYLAYLEFLQALFIKKRTYPISYTKWIEEQLLDILGLSSLFPHVKSLLTIDTLGEDQLKKKAQHLRKLGCSFIGTDGPLEKTA